MVKNRTKIRFPLLGICETVLGITVAGLTLYNTHRILSDKFIEQACRTKPTNQVYLLSKYDKNKDGIISNEEIRQFYHEKN